MAFDVSVSLQVLEACMKNCGRRFHNEIARYRFLNELIKVVSPKVGGFSFILLCFCRLTHKLASPWFPTESQ